MDSNELCSRIEKPVESVKPGAILASLWRRVLVDTNITPVKFNNLITRMVQKNNRKKSDRLTTTMTKSHITRQLTTDDLTWKVFIMGLFECLNVKKIRVIITLEHYNGEVTSHEIPAINANFTEMTLTGGDTNNNAVNNDSN